MEKETKLQVSIEVVRKIVHALKTKGVANLQEEQLAICLTVIGFPEVCKTLGVEWTSQNEREALERLKKANFDIPWLYQQHNNNNKKMQSILQTQYAPFLVHCSRGDVGKCRQFLKKLAKDQKEQLRVAVDPIKRSALTIVCKQGYDVLVDYLISEGWSVHHRDRELRTPLHHACIGGFTSICYTLLKHKAQLLVKDNKGQTPLHYAVGSSTSSVLIGELLDKYPNLTDMKDLTGKTALHLAVMNNSESQVDIMRVLIEKGADINAKDDESRTPLHYASECGKVRAIPILMKYKASLTLKDNFKKTPMDLAANQRVKKLISAYCNAKEIGEDKQLEAELSNKLLKTGKVPDSKIRPASAIKNPEDRTSLKEQPQPAANNPNNNPLLGGDVNQVATWLRDKFFVLMKKIQITGVKAFLHVKRPYIYTGSWVEGIENIEDLYTALHDVQGPEAAMRVFNILCPYEKKLPPASAKVQSLEGFFGESWFGTQPVENIKKFKGEDKLKKELEQKNKQIQDIKIELLGYKAELDKTESEATDMKQQLRQYKKLEEEIRRERTKSAKQYSEILKLTDQNQELRKQLADISGGQDEVTVLKEKIQELKVKNEDLNVQISSLKSYEAAARRKCGKLFLKALQNPLDRNLTISENMYDDDAIISLYESLENNPPGLVKRLQSVDRNGDGKLNVQQFNTFLDRLKLLPQDIMALNRIVGFVGGKKHLGIQEFRDILENRPQLRVQWQKKLIKKIKDLIKKSEVGSIQKLFSLLDVDDSKSVTVTELKEGLEAYNIFINQKDLNNFFSMLDADKSGTISLEELKVMLGNQQGRKKIPVPQDSERKESRNDKKNKGKQKKKNEKTERSEKSKSKDDGESQQQEEQGEGQQQNQENEVSQHTKSRVTEHQSSRKDEQNSEQEDNKYQSQADQNESQKEKDRDSGQQEEEEQQEKSNQDQNQENEEQKSNKKSDGGEDDHGEQEGGSKNNQNQSEQQDSNKEQTEQSQSQQEQEVQEQQQDEGPKISGCCKLQIPMCKNLLNQEDLDKVYFRISFCDNNIVKMGDFTNKRWEIAVKFEIDEKYEADMTSLHISAFSSRDFDEEHYLGEVEIELDAFMSKPNQWGVNKSIAVESREFEKQVTGAIAVQVKWIPKQDS